MPSSLNTSSTQHEHLKEENGGELPERKVFSYLVRWVFFNASQFWVKMDSHIFSSLFPNARTCAEKISVRVIINCDELAVI